MVMADIERDKRGSAWLADQQIADIVRFVVELGQRIDGAGGRRLYLRCAQLL